MTCPCYQQCQHCQHIRSSCNGEEIEGASSLQVIIPISNAAKYTHMEYSPATVVDLLKPALALTFIGKLPETNHKTGHNIYY